jgi:hypothetical protein
MINALEPPWLPPSYNQIPSPTPKPKHPEPRPFHSVQGKKYKASRVF